MTSREELIEEAANAMSQGFVKDGRVSSSFALAEAALAVFEKAQAPTDDEMIEVYNEAVRESMTAVKERDGYAFSGSRESIVAGLRAVAGSRRPTQTEGYHVEIGDQRLTQAQWEAVQRYCEGRPVAPEPSALPEYFAPNPPMTTNRFTVGQEEPK